MLLKVKESEKKEDTLGTKTLITKIKNRVDGFDFCNSQEVEQKQKS